MSELYLVRHAQASFHADDYDQLSELGYQQSSWLGEYFAERELSFDHVLRGDMKRHRQTVERIDGALRSGPKARVHAGLNEYDFGSLLDAFQRRYPERESFAANRRPASDKKLFLRLLRDALAAWSGGELDGVDETWVDFRRRVRDAQHAIHELAAPGSRVLVVSSGGAISMMTGLILNLAADKIIDLNFQIKNTAIAHFYFNRDGFSLSGFNGVPHLDRPQRQHAITFG